MTRVAGHKKGGPTQTKGWTDTHAIKPPGIGGPQVEWTWNEKLKKDHHWTFGGKDTLEMILHLYVYSITFLVFVYLLFNLSFILLQIH